MNELAIMEALLFAAGEEGLTYKQMADVLDIQEERVYELVQQLKHMYDVAERGIMVVEMAGTLQLVTKKQCAPYLQKLVESPTTSSLSQAALETLAIIAYRQPITRAEIEHIRGVKSDKPLQTLLGKALIKEVGRAEGTGRPILYGTTKEFLDYFGLKTLDELPPLPEWDEQGEEREADLFFERLNEQLQEASEQR
ncbi:MULTISPECIES: SMC-Scp complex subunit ScpB [Anoxybacillus]|uniref:Segregation and condensation protein B n=1 Tax=Anoxybacillus flavithermus TaxID=33934 RepID=A0A178TBK9_9BACL|nr:SMC-Scp complex subunit ScpB [Anoxybacillus flavithermus]ELK22178.1 segregation and condensation protein B [Anoxybacillus flavithermus TNO-09.006]MBE2904396.1 SMC-Scp complex subunit ScpB [Anoxybacillus flavithermus]MBE2907391.1 SMC-Scp complex subunit ScpB [Anoxybacillus flavithermus]MBE2910173.1 SMC-Scp complex subunit ScpB [Anoxybacillus flavithermus]MBE2915397.1 SMC-Scp complex subunit ScpB [Anoxybacillus flavithermus]